MKPSAFHHRFGSLAISLGLVALVAAIYGQIGRHPFVVFDDVDYLLDNPHVSRGLSREGVAWAFTSFHAANWHPLTWLSHMLDAQLFGIADSGAGGHHLVSALLHAANAVLLLLFLRRTTGHLWTSALVAALFAAHPLRVESVAWASERKDVLSGFFFMLTLLAYSRYAGRRGMARYSLVLLALILGLLAKPMLVTVPLVLLLLDVWPLRRWRPADEGGAGARALVLEKLPLLAASIASSWVTLGAQTQSGAVLPLANVPLDWRLIQPPISYATYLWKTIWPAGLAVFYPHPASLWFESSRSWLLPAALCALLLLAITAVAVSAVRAHPCWTVGWLWFLVMLVPVIGLVQTGAQSWADRYAYLPLIGIYLIVAFGLREWTERRRARRTWVAWGACAMIAALGTAAWLQVGKWRDSRTLFEHTLRVTRNNWLIHNNLGVLLAGQGRGDEARRHFEEALRIHPSYAQAHDNLGALLLRQGRLEEARRHFQRAIELSPGYAQAHFDLAGALEKLGEPDEARAHLERSLSIRPDWRIARERLARLLIQSGEFASAAVEIERLANAYPSHAEYAYLAGMVHETRGDSSAAGPWYRRAAELPDADPAMRAKARSFAGAR